MFLHTAEADKYPFQIIVFVWSCQRSVLYSAAVPAAPGSAVAAVLRTKPCVSGSL